MRLFSRAKAYICGYLEFRYRRKHNYTYAYESYYLGKGMSFYNWYKQGKQKAFSHEFTKR